MSRLAPPTGAAPPLSARAASGDEIDLKPLAEAICRRYDEEFPDERERYGAAGRAWCVHDNLYLLSWGILDAEHGWVELDSQVRWLAGVLAARDFPLARLARDLEIAAEEVVRARPELGHVGRRLGEAADLVRRLPQAAVRE